MSPLLRSEIRVRLGAQRASAAVWTAGWTPRCVAQWQVDADSTGVLAPLLDAMPAIAGRAPRRVVLQLDDGLLYFATWPARAGYRRDQAQVQGFFESALDLGEMQVGMTLVDEGRQWLCAALPQGQLGDWQLTLRERGLTLGGVRSALIDDLATLRPDPERPQQLLAMLRPEGLGLVPLARGTVQSLSWERCDPGDVERVRERIEQARTHMGLAQGPAAVLLCGQPLGRDDADWSALAQTQGWQFQRLPQPLAPGVQP